MKYLRLTITDTMSFWDNYLETYLFNPDIGKSFTNWYRLPDEWIINGKLTPDKLESVFCHLYGATWRSGNGDGSQYMILETDQHELSAEEVVQRVWEQTGESCFTIGDDASIFRIDAKQF
jgi:hypothetical protein